MIRKLRDERGFTLIEMLCATIILVLLALMVNTGMHMAADSYRNVVLQSETKLLLTTLSDTIADELRFASDVTTASGNVSYKSARYYGQTTLSVNADGQVVANVSGTSYNLLPGAAYGKDTWKYGVGSDPDDFKITYTDGVFTVKIIIYDKSPGGSGAKKAEAEFQVACLNP